MVSINIVNTKLLQKQGVRLHFWLANRIHDAKTLVIFSVRYAYAFATHVSQIISTRQMEKVLGGALYACCIGLGLTLPRMAFVSTSPEVTFERDGKIHVFQTFDCDHDQLIVRMVERVSRSITHDPSLHKVKEKWGNILYLMTIYFAHYSLELDMSERIRMRLLGLKILNSLQSLEQQIWFSPEVEEIMTAVDHICTSLRDRLYVMDNVI